MNLLLFDEKEITDSGHVVLTDRRAEHLRRVLDVRVGQQLAAGIVRGPHVIATVLAVGSTIELLVEVGPAVEIPWLDLVIALPRPKAMPRLAQAAASFGVRRIDIINAWRVEASYFSSPKLSPQSLSLEVRLGCEQGRQTWVPDVEVHRFFMPYVEQILRPRLATDPTRRLIVAHPGADQGIESLLLPGSRHPVVLAVGPDGGFVGQEIATLEGIGGQVAHFGQAVLRSEVAVVALLAQVHLLRRLPSKPEESAPVASPAPGGAAEPSVSPNSRRGCPWP